MMARLLTLLRNLGRQPTLLLKMALLTVVWGLVLSGAFSLQRAMVARQLPDLKQQMTQQAAQVAGVLAQLGEPLASLLNDPRINGQDSAQNSGESDMGRRRALYEFSYLQQQVNVYAVNLSNGQAWQPAGAVPFPVKVDELAKQVAGGRETVRLLRPEPRALGGAPGILLMAARPAQNVLVAVLLPWSQLMEALPPTFPTVLGQGLPLERGATATVQLLFSGDGENWQQVNSAGALSKADAQHDADGTADGIGDGPAAFSIAVPLSGLPGWQLRGSLSALTMSGQVFLMQMGLVLAGVLATVLLLRPDRWLFSLGKQRAARARATSLLAAAGGAYAGASGGGAAGSGGRGSLTGGVEVSHRDIPGLNAGVDPQAGRSAEARADTPEGGVLQAEQERQKQRAQMKTVSMLQKINMALESDGVYGLYQPIFQASDGQPVMHEVLCRLREPNGSELQPGAFMPVARQENLMPRLDAEILKVVLRTYFAGGRQPATKLCLNISSTSMAGLTYMTSLMDSAYTHALPYLVFEVRSQEILGDPSAMRFLQELKEMGGQLSVDYFGGGRKMLEASKALGFDYVKISIAERWQDMNQRRELLGIAKTAASLKLNVVMEKVEVQPMEVFSRRIGVPFMQGYHFAKPEPALSTKVLPSWRDGFAKESEDAAAAAHQAEADALAATAQALVEPIVDEANASRKDPGSNAA